MANLSRAQLLDLIEVGIQAPSADNRQPWIFHLIPDGFELGIDSRQLGKFFDAKGAASQITCGALVENVIRLAAAQGLEASIRYFDCSFEPGSDQRWVARLQFRQDQKPGDVEATRRMIQGRHTNRFLYDSGRTLTQDTLSELMTETLRTPGYELISHQDKKSIHRLARAFASADTIRFTIRKNHEEFYEALRFGEEAIRSRDGLAVETLGLSNSMIQGLKTSKPWPVQRFLNYLGMHYFTAFLASFRPLKASSAIASIIHHGPADYYEFGRVMQSFWLRANQLGLSVQPMGALPLFFARLSLVQGEGFSPSQKQKLARIQKEFTQVTPGFHPESDQLVMVFRVGYSDRPPPRSLRRKVEDFISSRP